MKDSCHSCGDEKRLGTHWAQSSCEYPNYSERHLEMITGLLMGDGYLRDKPKAKNPYFVVAMINETFLEWLDDQFGVRSHGVSLKTSSEYITQRAERIGFGNGSDGDYHDVYQLRFRSHPVFHEFTDWYTDDGKKFPDDLMLTPELVRMWYVCDGGINQSEYAHIEIYSKNELDRIRIWVNKFQELGFDCSESTEGLKIHRRSAHEFLDWIGEPPNGFEYKWELDDRKRYDELKKEVYS